jgi:hypothetical protein
LPTAPGKKGGEFYTPGDCAVAIRDLARGVRQRCREMTIFASDSVRMAR